MSRVAPGDYLSFAWARFARVYPIHLFTLVAAIAMQAWWVGYLGKPSVAWIANAALLQAWFPNSVIQNRFNAPSWSVSCEAFFYALFPFAAHFVTRLRTAGLLIAGTFVWSLCWIGMSAYNQYLLSAGYSDYLAETAPTRMPLFRIGEFFAGCCAGVWFVRRGPTGRNQNALLALSLVPLIATIGAGLAWPQGVSFSLRSPMLYTPALVGLLLALVLGPTTLSPLLRSRPILLLGEASYSLYMIHWLALYVLWGWYGRGSAPLWATVATGGACVVVSVVSYKLIEAPTRRILKSRFSTRTTTPATVRSATT